MNAVIAAIAGKTIGRLLDKLLGNNPDAQAMKNAGALLKVVQKWADADRNGGWLQRTWRPALMTTFILVVLLYLFIDPLLGLCFDIRVPEPNLDAIPPEVWELLKWFSGIYAAGRTVEKTVRVRADVRKQTEQQPTPSNYADQQRYGSTARNREEIRD